MKTKTLVILLFCLGSSQAKLFGKGGIVDKIAGAIGLDNIVSLDGDAQANLLGNKVGIDAAVGVGRQGVGAHAGGTADILGQKANIRGNILDGRQIDENNHKVYRDENGRQYVLQRKYVGSQLVWIRDYLDKGTYFDGEGGSNAAVPKTSDNLVLVNEDKYPVPAHEESKVFVSDNNRVPSNGVDDESVVIRGDDDNEYWVKGNNGKLIRTYVSNDEAVPQKQNKDTVYYYYH